MKRIKSVNGYTIYEATSARDEANYNCRVGSYNIYISSDIRDFGLSNSYAEYEDIDSLSVAEAMCGASKYAVAVDLAEEISGSTAQDMDLVLEIERLLESGMSIEGVRDHFDEDLHELDELGERLAAVKAAQDIHTDAQPEQACDFCSDEEKMTDFAVMSKEAFLSSYSYLTEEEYDLTAAKVAPPTAELLAVMDTVLEEDYSVDFGGPDHMGETVREFIESTGDHPTTIDELNAMLRCCGILPVAQDIHTETEQQPEQTMPADMPEDSIGLMLYELEAIQPGDYLLEPSNDGIVRVLSVDWSGTYPSFEVEYPNGARGNFGALHANRMTSVTASSDLGLRRRAADAWAKLAPKPFDLPVETSETRSLDRGGAQPVNVEYSDGSEGWEQPRYTVYYEGEVFFEDHYKRGGMGIHRNYHSRDDAFRLSDYCEAHSIPVWVDDNHYGVTYHDGEWN